MTDSSNRIAPLIPAPKDELLECKRRQDYMKRQNPALNAQGFVFTTEQGSYIGPRTYRDLFKRILKEAGGADANFRSLRHTSSTGAMEQGVDALALAKILGHAQPSATLNIYGNVLPDHKREGIRKMRSFYCGETGTAGAVELMDVDVLHVTKKKTPRARGFLLP
ncbi:MAG: tyrosine-type recombinase/integrase [Oscillospiraceae bacterium]|nr:tyrosine-type recombinase/integrase [Oscillospiraceae bacterium]